MRPAVGSAAERSRRSPFVLTTVPTFRVPVLLDDLHAVWGIRPACYGLKRIAMKLTAEDVATPLHVQRSGLKPCTGWGPSTVRAVLGRETYHGVIVWNKTRKKERLGQTCDQRSAGNGLDQD
jgi:hypothetical protein